MPAEEAVGGTPGGRWGREQWGGRGSLQRQQQVTPTLQATGMQMTSLPLHHNPGGLLLSLFQGRALQPQRQGRNDRDHGAGMGQGLGGPFHPRGYPMG